MVTRTRKSPNNSGEDVVIAPGGPRKRASIQHVKPGETVVEDAGGHQHVAAAEPPRAAAAASAGTTEAAVDDYVATPGGFRPRSMVHLITDGAVIDATDHQLRSLHVNGSTLAEFGTMQIHAPERPLRPGSIGRVPGAVVPAFGDGWITYASWTNNTGRPVSRFATRWVVPPEPTTHSNQIIFLFNGIQNSTMIYQPVLQWGVSAAGGGPYWAVASWYADGQTGTSFHSNLVRVNAGDILEGVMTLTAQNTHGFSYNCSFSGINGASLPIQNVQELTWCIETLEAYRVTQISDYPDCFETAMTAIDIEVGGNTHPALAWTAVDRVTDTGQHTVVASNSSTAGEVDLCYSAEPVYRAQGLAWYGGKLYAAWKGISDDDRLFFSSYGRSWAAQQTIAGNTRTAASLATYSGKLWAAWKGMHGDQRLFYSSSNGVTWATQKVIPGVASRVGPSLAEYNGKLYAAWRGMDSDQAIWYSSFNGSSWSAQRTIPGVASLFGPSLAQYNGRLYAAWKGMNNDQAIWWSSFDGTSWRPQRTIPGVASSVGPSLAECNGRLYAAWKGMGDDQAIYWSTFDGTSWAPQQGIPAVATSVGPVIAFFNSKIAAMWKGMNNDERLFYSFFDGHTWTPQAILPGDTGPDLD